MRIAVIGNSGPLLRFLERVRSHRQIDWLACYLQAAAGPSLEEAIRSLGMSIERTDELVSPEGTARLHSLAPDWILCVNANAMLPPATLACARQGALNAHPGPLPEYAGLFVPQWAIRNGECSFGVTIHWMTDVVDAGPIALRVPLRLDENDTGLTATMKANTAAADAMATVVEKLVRGERLPREPQDLSLRRLYRKADALDGRVDWSLPAKRLVDFVRAADFGPFPPPTYRPTARFRCRDVVLLRVAVGVGADAPPGTIVRSGNEGLSVAAGEGTTLLLDTVRLADGARLRGASIAERLAAAPGDAFSSVRR